MRNTVLYDIYLYSLESESTVKQLVPVSFYVHLSKHFTWFLLKFVENY